MLKFLFEECPKLWLENLLECYGFGRVIGILNSSTIWVRKSTNFIGGIRRGNIVIVQVTDIKEVVLFIEQL